MREEAKRLCETPLGQRVRRKALVEKADRRLQARVAQVRVKIRQCRGHDHALVADRHGRQAGNIGFAILEVILGASPREEQAPIEAAALHAFRRVDEHLLDARQRLERDLAARRRVGRHLAPAGHFEARFPNGRLDHGARCRRGRLVMAQKYGAGRETIGEREAQFLAHAAQESKWKLDQQAAAVAGLAIRGHGTAMREPGQRGDRGLHDGVTGQIVEIGDQPETAAVALERRVVKPCRTSLY